MRTLILYCLICLFCCAVTLTGAEDSLEEPFLPAAGQLSELEVVPPGEGEEGEQFSDCETSPKKPYAPCCQKFGQYAQRANRVLGLTQVPAAVFWRLALGQGAVATVAEFSAATAIHTNKYFGMLPIGAQLAGSAVATVAGAAFDITVGTYLCNQAADIFGLPFLQDENGGAGPIAGMLFFQVVARIGNYKTLERIWDFAQRREADIHTLFGRVDVQDERLKVLEAVIVQQDAEIRALRESTGTAPAPVSHDPSVSHRAYLASLTTNLPGHDGNSPLPIWDVNKQN